MRLIIAEDYDDLSRIAARLVADVLRAIPRAAISVPTGATPTGFYTELAALHRGGAFDATALRVFQLDEYLGAASDDPRSFAAWITRAFVEPLGISTHQVTWLRGDASDAEAACHTYDEVLRLSGGLDVVVLGLGENGHIGFNEPPAEPDAPTRVVRLTDETRAANAVYWGSLDAVPQSALTCGMVNLLAARMKIVLVSGEHKRTILHRTLHGSMTDELPASYLQHAEGVIVIADRAAAPEADVGAMGGDDAADSG